jgi:hypothetical protein
MLTVPSDSRVGTTRTPFGFVLLSAGYAQRMHWLAWSWAILPRSCED